MEMRCLFCKSDSTNSRSVEHIIPESLGNTKHVLPKGVVCDRCNNYFSREVEKPFLDAPAVRALRFHETLESKKGKVPSIVGFMSPGIPVSVTYCPKTETTSVYVPEDAISKIQSLAEGRLILPTSGPMPSASTVSRFMAKIALESMAARLVEHPDGLDYLCDEVQLDPLRDHARKGRGLNWPVNMRRIYAANAKFFDDDGAPVQMVHESDFLVTPAGEWFFVLAIFGVEFVINLGGPEIDGYLQWLEENSNASPLYSAKNQHLFSLPQEPEANSP